MTTYYEKVNNTKLLHELTFMYMNPKNNNISIYYSGCTDLHKKFAGEGLKKSILSCKEYIKDPNISLILKTYLEWIINSSERKSYIDYCNSFFEFYKINLSHDNIINGKTFINLFSNKESFKKINNHLLLKDLKNRLPQIFKYLKIKDNNYNNYNEIIEFYKEMHTEDSDYYPGVYSNNYNGKNNTGKDFRGLPTRVSYGLMIQWNHKNDWEKNKNIKVNTIPNKDKFEYFIKNKDKQKYLNNLAEKLNCKISDIIDLFINICNVDDIKELDEPIKYFLRAFYLWSFLKNYKANIRINSTGKPFIKKIRVEDKYTGEYKKTETVGTFLSEVYDSYNNVMYNIKKANAIAKYEAKTKGKDIDKKSVKYKSRKSPNGINEVKGELTNRKINSINKFSPMSKTYIREFPFLKKD